jgi:glycosyltransferase involved in cell wall biosynthesis
LNKTFEEFEFGNGFENKNILLFVGMLAYTPNVMGLNWFIQTIYGKFKLKHPDAKLLVVGNLGESDDSKIKKICQQGKNIELHTNVPDVKEYYKKSKVVIVPLLTGGGTRIKILEAALAERPILSTRIGSEGLCFENDRELLNFSNAEEFIEKFSQICKPKTYEDIVSKAKHTVIKNYSKEKFENMVQKAIDIIDKLHFSQQ